MRFTPIVLALLGVVSGATSNQSVIEDKIVLKSQLMTLKKLAILAEREQGVEILEAISDRKDQLQSLAEMQPARKTEVVSELRSLISLVEATDAQDYESVIQQLSASKDMLIESNQALFASPLVLEGEEEEAPAEEEEAPAEEGGEEAPAEEGGEETPEGEGGKFLLIQFNII